tara:strand:- start:231 stop:449 length:219 start_codon:yes stop_codon:yes gene_type:complete
MYDVIEKLFTHQGWAVGSKLDYLSKKHLKEGLDKEEIRKVSVDKYGLFKSDKSFESSWNRFLRIKSDIKYVR